MVCIECRRPALLLWVARTHNMLDQCDNVCVHERDMGASPVGGYVCQAKESFGVFG